jgi:pyruvate dehydrogenase E2 component (dihydrolipoamide acetyltransferase)
MSGRRVRIPNWWEEDAGTAPADGGRQAMPAIRPITMPKWGLAMEEGMLARWAVAEGETIAEGQEIMDIETSKIANVFESPVAGVLRRKVVQEGDTVPVGALLGVVAEANVPDADVDGFVAEFLSTFKPAAAGEGDQPVAEVIEVGGRRLRHLRAGPETGEPIVLLHGFGADMSTWMFNHAALAEDRPVYALDLPGHGGSAKELDDGSVAALAVIVADYLDAVGIDSAHLIGHSLGGAIAASVALDRPERVTALTLIAPAGLGADIAHEFIEGFINETRARKLRPVIEMLVADPGLVTADMVEEVLKFKRLDGAVGALRTVADANFSGGQQRVSLRERLGEIEVPIRILWGEEDRILPVSHAEGLPETIAVTRVPGAGHIVHMERATEVNEAIRAMSGAMRSGSG